MGNLKRSLRFALVIAGLFGLFGFLTVTFQILIPNEQPLSGLADNDFEESGDTHLTHFWPDAEPAQTVTANLSYPWPHQTEVPQPMALLPNPYPYPYPDSQLVITFTPAPPAQFYKETPQPYTLEQLTFPYGTVVTIFKGDIWSIYSSGSDSSIDRLTRYTDVAGIFGFNHDNTLLLFSRGRLDHGDICHSTDLWVFEVASHRSWPLVQDSLVMSASWSPVDNRIAYLEFRNWSSRLVPGILCFQPAGSYAL